METAGLGASLVRHSTASVAAPAASVASAAPAPADAQPSYCLFPLRYPKLYEMYHKAVSCFWTAQEVDLARDVRDWEELTDNERHFIKHVLAFFAGSDGIVSENLVLNFFRDVTAQEARCFYTFQMAMESVHAEMYSLMIDTYVKDEDEKARLFDAVRTVPGVAKKAAWALRYTDRERSSFAERLLAFACVEGVHFSGSFAAIFWLKSRGKMPGLAMSNEFISRDEALHTDFAVELYHTLVPPGDRLTEAAVHAMYREAVDVEREFITESLPCSLLGMNSGLMGTYVEFVADRLLLQLGYAPIYGHRASPFDFMEMCSLTQKANFFEKRESSYTRAPGGDETTVDTTGDF